MGRLTKIDKRSECQKKALIKDFRNAPMEPKFTPETIALVYHLSLAWLQKKRCEGGRIPFTKPTAKTVLYKKEDVLGFIDNNRLQHTA
ncbi:DNA-binding protein [Acinetobacter sp. TSRC1-2]|uniref:DNA-binding protein n=1 Tax=unclassified Acinetobacter TaxID=196816 RepID=UPI003CF5CD30